MDKAASSVWWPGVNAHIKSKYANCMICMQLKRTNTPSTPVCEAAADIKSMDILSCDWMSIEFLHVLVYVEKVKVISWQSFLAI